ncbi:MAG TPA: hypothetical protein VK700_17075 [Steroidobacteraceae bacterium]|nr:hypothetical protein [Steroidobacteraceae bacterium]
MSVVSLLARMNLDPWQEAGTLADLPAEAAAKRLAGSLATLTDPGLRQAISETLILRLLALLPRRGVATARIPAASVDTVAAHAHSNRLQAIIFIASTLVLLAGSQLLAAHRIAPTRSGAVPGPAVMTAPARGASPPSSP